LGSSIKSFLKGKEKEVIELIKTKNDMHGFYKNQNYYNLDELRKLFSKSTSVMQALSFKLYQLR